jgi:peptidoglycan/LPS O-acetylase OafA/YrhL
MRNGYLAVDLFFILSGLVISANYSTRVIDIATGLDFMRLRFFRLYPLHVVLLFSFVFLECIKFFLQGEVGVIPAKKPFSGGESFPAFIANIFLIHGLVVNQPNWNGPSWSISCEFFAYVLFVILGTTKLIHKVAFFIIGSGVAAVAYVAIVLGRGTLDVVFYLGIVRCLAGFFLGMLIFKFAGKMRLRWQSTFSVYQLIVSIAIILCMTLVSGPLVVLIIPLFALAIALLQADRGPVVPLLMCTSVQFLGRISYSIYMVHSIIIVCILIVLKRLNPMVLDLGTKKLIVAVNPWVGDFLVLGTIIMVLAVASKTYSLIEEPGRLFGRKLVQSPGDRIDKRVLRT